MEEECKNYTTKMTKEKITNGDKKMLSSMGISFPALEKAMEEKYKKVRIYSKECPICLKKFEGQNLKQLRYNFQLHYGSCLNKQKKEKKQ
jgi:hypothetical protein